MASDVRIAIEIRAIMEEIKNRIISLSMHQGKHYSDSPELIAQLIPLADLLGEDVVLSAVAIVEAGGVKMIIEGDEKAKCTPSEKKAESNCGDEPDLCLFEDNRLDRSLLERCSQELLGNAATSVQSPGEPCTTSAKEGEVDVEESNHREETVPNPCLNEDSDLDQSVLGIPDHSPDLLGEASVQSSAKSCTSSAKEGVEESNRREEVEPCLNEEDLHQSVIGSPDFSPDLFGKASASLQPSCASVDEEEPIWEEVPESLGEEQEGSARNSQAQIFLEITSDTCSQGPQHILPNVNFCFCDFFQDTVLRDKDAFTCSHVVAGWLASALGNIQRSIVRCGTSDVIVKHFIDSCSDL